MGQSLGGGGDFVALQQYGGASGVAGNNILSFHIEMGQARGKSVVANNIEIDQDSLWCWSSVPQ